MNANTNLVLFPSDRIVRVKLPESTQEAIQKTQKTHINQIIEEQADSIASRLAMSGVDISSDDFQKAFALSIECLRASVYATVGLHHPMHRPMKEMIEEIDIIIERKD